MEETYFIEKNIFLDEIFPEYLVVVPWEKFDHPDSIPVLVYKYIGELPRGTKGYVYEFVGIRLSKKTHIKYEACICVDFINGNPDPVVNPDCRIHGSLR